jgi:ribosomal protein S12 methylthiotransferase
VQEATFLANRGVKELILIAQELTYYGLDLYQRRALPELLERLSAVAGIDWIRLHYAYPHKFPLEIIDVMRRHDTICNYLDMPLQHISDPVLARMRRQITAAETSALINNIRTIHPAIRLRTTFLVGFPGETENDHLSLCRFVEEMKFDRVGVFEYSHEEGTRGYAFEDDVPAETKKRRAEEIMEIQRGISLEKNESLIGQMVRVLIDRKEGAYYVARSEFDSPEVDNEVWVEKNGSSFQPGQLITVKITGASDYDLTAQLHTN